MWFWRDCDACRAFIFNDKGDISRDPEGTPWPNPCPPVCEATPCKRGKDGKPREKPRFSDYDHYVYELWEMSKYTHSLPAEGGLEDQDAELMERFLVLFRLDAVHHPKVSLF